MVHASRLGQHVIKLKTCKVVYVISLCKCVLINANNRSHENRSCVKIFCVYSLCYFCDLSSYTYQNMRANKISASWVSPKWMKSNRRRETKRRRKKSMKTKQWPDLLPWKPSGPKLNTLEYETFLHEAFLHEGQTFSVSWKVHFYVKLMILFPKKFTFQDIIIISS